LLPFPRRGNLQLPCLIGFSAALQEKLFKRGFV
jgi:hypothetical protein